MKSAKRGVKVKYKIKGYNHELLINRLIRSGAEIREVSKRGGNGLAFSVREEDDEKVFAILNKMCYNIVSRRKCGGAYPVYLLAKMRGAIVGILIFIAAMILSDTLVFKIKVTGSGSIYQDEIVELLKEEGIGIFSVLSDKDMLAAENLVLREFEHLDFVSAQKRGNILIIDAHFAQGKPDIQDKKEEDVRAPISGTVRSCKVLRGTPMKKEGDSIEAGETIVGAFYESLNGEKIPTYVLCEIQIEATKTFVFDMPSGYEYEALAAQMAVSCVSGEVIGCVTGFSGGKLEVTVEYIYTVTGG